jgi:hypothetical protein
MMVRGNKIELGLRGPIRTQVQAQPSSRGRYAEPPFPEWGKEPSYFL